MATNKKAVIYVRSAKEAQKKTSLNIQKQICKNAAEQDGCEVVEVISETGSGANMSRKGIKKLIVLIEKNEIDSVYVLNIDRISRNPSDLLSFQQLLKKYKVKLITGDGYKIDSEMSPEKIFLESIAGSMANYERRIHSQKIKRGLAVKHAGQTK